MATNVEGEAATPVQREAFAGQTLQIDGKTLTSVQEGLAHILIPPDAPLITDPAINQKDGTQRASVFYNPIQQYNRDLTILVLKAFGEDFIAKAREVTARRNAPKKQKPRKELRATHAVQTGARVSTTTLQDGTQIDDAVAGASKRKREIADDGQSVASSDAPSNDKRLCSDVLPAVQDATQGPPLFSSMVRERVATQEDVDDSFGDGGIGEDDFLLAEQNAMQTSNLNADLNGHGPASAEKTEGGDSARKATPFRILDALSASGLRALRYAKELPFVTSITANDLSAEATKSMRQNILYNNFSNPKIIKVVTGNAIAHMANSMYQNSNKYTVIDLDPYGTAVPFLDTAVQAVADGGLLCVTCTDSAIFNSMGYLEKTFSQYGGLPVRGDFCHEAGVRLILHAIASTAGKYGISIEPLLSLSIDYYARVFVRIRRSAAEVKLLGAKTMLVYNCDTGCGAWTAQPLVRVQEKATKNGDVLFKFTSAQGPTTEPVCEHCGFKRHVAGPMWGGPLHNPAFLERVLDVAEAADPAVYQTAQRIRGMISTALEETHLYDVPESIACKTPQPPSNDPAAEPQPTTEFARVPAQIIDKHPFYFDASSLARVLHCAAPSNAQMQGALRHLGYRCVRSHARAGAIKTDAPFGALWRVMRLWLRRSGGKVEQRAGTAGAGVMKNGANANGAEKTEEEEEEELDVVFDEVLGRQESRVRGLVRYQQNPRENWGPMARAKVTARKKGARNSSVADENDRDP